MGYAKIKGKLTSRIGRAVNYSAPNDLKQKGRHGAPHGRIVDDFFVTPSENSKPPHRQPCPNEDCWGDYSFSSQLIEWDDGTHAIRMVYFRRRCGEDWWEYASQHTVSAEPADIKALLEATLSKVHWFDQN